MSSTQTKTDTDPFPTSMEQVVGARKVLDLILQAADDQGGWKVRISEIQRMRDALN